MINYFLPRTVAQEIGPLLEEFTDEYFSGQLDSGCIVNLIERLLLSDPILADKLHNLTLTNLSDKSKTLFDILSIDTTDELYQIELETRRQEKISKFGGDTEAELCKLIVYSDIHGFKRHKVQEYITLYEANRIQDEFYEFSYLALKSHVFLQRIPTLSEFKRFLSDFSDTPIINAAAIRSWFILFTKHEYSLEIVDEINRELKTLAVEKNQLNYFMFQFLASNYLKNDLFKDQLIDFLNRGFADRMALIKGILYPNYHCFVIPFLMTLREIYSREPGIFDKITLSDRERDILSGAESIEKIPGYYPGI